MSKKYDTVYMNELYLCVIFWFLSLGNCESVPDTIFLLPWIYSISGQQYSSVILYIKTLYVLKILQVIFYGQFIFLIFYPAI